MPQCIAKISPYQLLLFNIFVPLLLLAELFVVLCVHVLLISLHRVSHSALMSTCFDKFQFLRSAAQFSSTQLLDLYVHGCVQLLLFAFTGVCTACFRFLYCADGGSARVVYTSPTIHCDSTQYHSHQIIVIIWIIIYIFALPIMIFLLLTKRRQWISLVQQSDTELHMQSDDAAVAPPSINHASGSPASTLAHSYRHSSAIKSNAFTSIAPSSSGSSTASSSAVVSAAALSSFRRRFGVLFVMFHGDSLGRYWKVVLLVSKSLFCLFDALFVQQLNVRFMVFGLLHLCCLLSHVYIEPYTLPLLNQVECVAHVLLTVMCFFLAAYTPPHHTAEQVILFILIVPPTLCLLALYATDRAKRLQQAMAGKFQFFKRDKSLSQAQSNSSEAEARDNNIHVIGHDHVDSQLAGDVQPAPSATAIARRLSSSTVACLSQPNSSTVKKNGTNSEVYSIELQNFAQPITSSSHYQSPRPSQLNINQTVDRNANHPQNIHEDNQNISQML